MYVRDQFQAAGIPLVEVEQFDVLLAYPMVRSYFAVLAP